MQFELPLEIICLIIKLLFNDNFNALIIFSKTCKLLNKTVKSWYLQRGSSKLKKVRIRLNCNEMAVNGQVHLIEWMKNVIDSNDSLHYHDSRCFVINKVPHDVVKCCYKRHTICQKTVEGGHLELLQWAVCNKCWLDGKLYLTAAQYDRSDIIN